MTDPQTQAARMADATCGMLRVARTLVELQRSVDLAGLQDAVGRVCAACLDLPPAQGRALRPQLAAVMAELDALSRALCAAADSGSRDDGANNAGSEA